MSTPHRPGEPRVRRRIAAVALSLAVVAPLAACGDDDDDDAGASAFASIDEWCASIGEVDELFLSADTEGADFATRQGQYDTIRDRIEELRSSVDLVDADARASVSESLDFGILIAGAFADATDDAAAVAAIEEIFGQEDLQIGEVGVTWILDNCGVDLDG